MNYNFNSLNFGIFLAIIVVAIEIILWNIFMKKHKKKKENNEKIKCLEDNNQILKDLFSKFEKLGKKKYAFSERKEYISCLKGRDIEQIQHARELLDTSLARTTYNGILITIFSVILSKAVSVMAEIYAVTFFESDSKAVTNIENVLIIAFWIFLIYVVLVSKNDYQRDKYLINIMQEEVKKKENDQQMSLENDMKAELEKSESSSEIVRHSSNKKID